MPNKPVGRAEEECSIEIRKFLWVTTYARVDVLDHDRSIAGPVAFPQFHAGFAIGCTKEQYATDIRKLFGC